MSENVIITLIICGMFVAIAAMATFSDLKHHDK
jgi:hypothetical protein